MNPTAIYSKSGKGVQEAAGKTSLLKRPDRAILAAIDGRANLKEVSEKVGRAFDASFQALIQQLDKEGFIREVTAGAPSGTPSRPMSPPSRPMSPPSRPAAPAAPAKPGADLDFSSLGATRIGGLTAAKPASPPSRPPAPPPPPSPQQVQQVKAQQSSLDKAREEAEAKAAADRDRLKKEAEDKARAELESKMRIEAERRMKEEAEAKAKAEAEAKIKAAREAAAKAAAEAKAKAEAEARAKVEAERKAREEMERRLEAERKAREEAERKAREEAERKAREAEELRQRLEAERKAREEAERKAREEAERRAQAEAERKARAEAERKARAEAERLQLEEQRRKEEQATRAAAEALAAAQAAVAKSPPAAQASAGGFADSLMSDLESFTNQDEVEQKARAEAERSSKLEAERRRREVAEREAAEAQRREEAEAQRREEESRKAREEEDRLAREEERRRREAEEIQRKAEAATAAAMARQAAASAEASPEQDIPIDDDDLDMTEVKKEQKALGIDEKKLREKEKQAEREARKRKRDEEKRRREAEKAAAKAAKAVAPSGRARRATSWSKPIALFLAFVLIIAIAAVHLVPLEVAPFEQAATQALGQPVRIGSARLWLFTGVQLRLENVRVGETRIREVHAHPSLAWLWDERKTFSLVELDRLSLPQAAFGEALLSRVRTEHFAVERVKVRSLELPGALALPKPLEADVFFDAKGAPRSVTLSGPDGLDARIVPKGDVVEFEATAGGLPLPIAPDVVLSKFAMKGRATRHGMDIAEWGGAIYNGAISGTARVRWGSAWDVDGAVTVRGINAAVFAPALLSEGNADGTGRFSMSAADATKLAGTGRLEGRFTIGKGTLGSFDLSRAIQTRGKQVTGTTQFAELNGQVTYDRGAVALRNVTIGAGALNAGASADIGKGGALSGRIVADVRTAAQTLSATLNLGGTVREPVVHD